MSTPSRPTATSPSRGPRSSSTPNASTWARPPAQAGTAYWGEPRRTGFQHNWARYADTTDRAIAGGQHTGAAAGIAAGASDYVVIFIGGNDFAPWTSSAYQNIYIGAWGEQEIAAFVAGRIANFRTMLDAFEGTDAQIVLTSPLDFNFMGFARNGHPTPHFRELVTSAVARCRDGVRALAREKRVAFLDLFRLNIDLFGPNHALRQQILVGNVPIRLMEAGDTGASGFIFDGVHTQRVVQAIWGQAIVAALNGGCGAAVPSLTESDMLAAGGLTYGGTDTLYQTLRPMRFYVQRFDCPADFNADRQVGVQDIFDFLELFFAGDIRADVDASATIQLDDLFSFLASYFSGCS